MGCLCAFIIFLGLCLLFPFIFGLIVVSIPLIPIAIGVCLIIFGICMLVAMF